jgi:hypothetical protein
LYISLILLSKGFSPLTRPLSSTLLQFGGQLLALGRQNVRLYWISKVAYM